MLIFIFGISVSRGYFGDKRVFIFRGKMTEKRVFEAWSDFPAKSFIKTTHLH
jgi:hypothetical protein